MSYEQQEYLQLFLKEKYEETDICANYTDGWCCKAGNYEVEITSTFSIDVITFLLSVILIITLCFLIVKLSLNYISLQVITFKPNGFKALKPKLEIGRTTINTNDHEYEEEDRNAIFSNNIYNHTSSYSTFSSDDDRQYKKNKNRTSNNNNNNNNNNKDEFNDKIYKNTFFSESSDSESLEAYSSHDKKTPKRNSPQNNHNNNHPQPANYPVYQPVQHDDTTRGFNLVETTEASQLRSHTVRPVHYLYILIVVTWLLVQSLILLLPIPPSSSILRQMIDVILYEVHCLYFSSLLSSFITLSS